MKKILSALLLTSLLCACGAEQVANPKLETEQTPLSSSSFSTTK